VRKPGRIYSSFGLFKMLTTYPKTERSIFTCSSCSASVFGGKDGCHKLFEEILTLEYSNPDYGAVHLLSVDAYVLQHSERHGPRSNAFHLIRLGWLLEKKGDPRIGRGSVRLKSVLRDYRNFPFLPPPESRGAMTVADVVDAAGPEEHGERVRRWARSVWDAWYAYHDWARDWLRGI
jgi:hypothetical protein